LADALVLAEVSRGIVGGNIDHYHAIISI
jgi:hypothetical protein